MKHIMSTCIYHDDVRRYYSHSIINLPRRNSHNLRSERSYGISYGSPFWNTNYGSSKKKLKVVKRKAICLYNLFIISIFLNCLFCSLLQLTIFLWQYSFLHGLLARAITNHSDLHSFMYVLLNAVMEDRERGGRQRKREEK